MAGYHIREITKGIVGEFSKISEEFVEFEDAVDQSSVVMALVELSDLVGAIEAFFAKRQKQNDFNELIEKVKNNSNHNVISHVQLKENFVILNNAIQADDYSQFENFLNSLDCYIKQYNLSMNDLYTMSQITKRVFENGYR